MTTDTEELIGRAESLPFEAKAHMVEKLLESMYPDRKEFDDLWKTEAQARVDQISSGKVNTIPGDRVFDEIRQRFGK